MKFNYRNKNKEDEIKRRRELKKAMLQGMNGMKHKKSINEKSWTTKKRRGIKINK